MREKGRMTEETLGARLLALKDRSRLSLENIAKAAGYKRASSIQRYFSPDYEAKFLPRELADRLKDALVGFGDPPIFASDVEYLTELGFLQDRRLPRPLSPEMFRRSPQRHIECNGTASAGAMVGPVEVVRIMDDPIRVFRRPEHLTRRSLDAFFVSDISMAPRHRPGDIVVMEAERPAMIGQDVFIEVGGGEIEGFIAALVARERDHVELEILNPPTRFKVKLNQIDGIRPLLSLQDLLTPSEQYDA